MFDLAQKKKTEDKLYGFKSEEDLKKQLAAIDQAAYASMVNDKAQGSGANYFVQVRKKLLISG